MVSIEANEQPATIKRHNSRMDAESVANLIGLINGEDVPKFTPLAGILITGGNVADFI